MPSRPTRIDESVSTNGDGSESVREPDHEGEPVDDDIVPATGKSSSDHRIRDPILVLLTAVRALLHVIDVIYRRFERLPGWARFGFGLATFVGSAYAGEIVRTISDEIVHLVIKPIISDFMKLSGGTRSVILLLILIALQTASVNQRTKTIEEELVGREMDDEENPVPDGGRVYRTRPRIGSSRSGALGGLTVGVGIGAFLGPGGMFGGAIFGAIVGDEIEKWYDRRRKRRRIAIYVLQSLLREGIAHPNSIPADRVRSWFPSRDADLVDQVLDRLTRDDDAPVERSADDQLWLTDMDEGEDFLRNGLDMITLPR